MEDQRADLVMVSPMGAPKSHHFNELLRLTDQSGLFDAKELSGALANPPDDRPPDRGASQTQSPAAGNDRDIRKDVQEIDCAKSTDPLRPEQAPRVNCQGPGCGNTIAPRAKRGGRSRLFCSDPCRRAADDDRKASKRNCGGRRAIAEAEPAPWVPAELIEPGELPADPRNVSLFDAHDSSPGRFRQRSVSICIDFGGDLLLQQDGLGIGLQAISINRENALAFHLGLKAFLETNNLIDAD